jgi:thymidylate synthase
MIEIIAKTVGQAWLETCRTILELGKNMKDNDESLREVAHMLIEIENPEENDNIIEKYGDKKAIEWMLSNFFEQKNVPELSNSQSYGIRLFNYEGKNQIKWIIDKLKEKPESKSATITTLMPNKDRGYIPCISLLDFKIRDMKLVLTAFCRSIDFGAKAYANMIALARMQDMVSKEVGVKKGRIILHAVSAHIYEKDFDNIKAVLSNSASEVNKR